ncbi:VWA domain-containing protein [Candidatus Pacearchaeota archaeon]|nr:VWA domain-containing protein [Candidatus Pacearchaeota archaeon]
MFIFTKPQFLIFLLAIPILVFFNIISIKLSKRRAIKFANFDAISRIKGADVFSKNLTILYIHIAIIILVVATISGMAWVGQVQSTDQSFVLVIDASRSMNANDIEPNRLEAAKKSALDFLQMVPVKTRIGVISFAGATYIEQEVTDDSLLLANAVNNIQIKDVGGTDMLNAIVASANLLANEESRTIIIMSDGSININSLQKAVDYAKANNIIVHTLGVGTQAGGVDEIGALFKISEETLTLLAESTGGKYYNIADLEDFYASLNDIILLTKKTAVFDLSLYLMILVIILFVLEFILISTRFRVFP